MFGMYAGQTALARFEHRDRHLAVVLEVLGQADGGHAALAELSLEGVAVGQGGARAFQWIHRIPG